LSTHCQLWNSPPHQPLKEVRVWAAVKAWAELSVNSPFEVPSQSVMAPLSLRHGIPVTSRQRGSSIRSNGRDLARTELTCARPNTVWC
jgi:hypothetical protein